MLILVRQLFNWLILSPLKIFFFQKDNVYPEAFLPDMFWERVELFLDGRLVSSSNYFRFITSLVSKRLYFNKSARNTYLYSELGNFTPSLDPDKTYADTDQNLKERRNRFVKDATTGLAPVVNLFGLITHELSTLTSPIIDGVDIMIRFHRNSSERYYSQSTQTMEREVGVFQMSTQVNKAY